MSNWREPVGPKDPKVYHRRRLLVLVGLLAVALVIVLIIVKPGSSSGGDTDTDDVAVPEDVAEQSAEDAAEDMSVCADGQLEITPVTDRTSYAESEEPKLSMSVENTGSEDCSVDLGTAAMTFEVSSGDDEVWRSVDCQEEGEHLNIALKAGQKLETEAITWDRTRSSTETCDITRDPVAAGGASYHLHVAVGEIDGDGTAQFILN